MELADARKELLDATLERYAPDTDCDEEEVLEAARGSDIRTWLNLEGIGTVPWVHLSVSRDRHPEVDPVEIHFPHQIVTQAYLTLSGEPRTLLADAMIEEYRVRAARALEIEAQRLLAEGVLARCDEMRRWLLHDRSGQFDGDM